MTRPVLLAGFLWAVLLMAGHDAFAQATNNVGDPCTINKKIIAVESPQGPALICNGTTMQILESADVSPTRKGVATATPAATPAATLDVNGEVRVGNTSIACGAGNEGAMRYNSTAKCMNVCDGSNWVLLDCSGAVCPTSGLIGHWKLDEGSGTSAADSSGGGHPGTLTNGPVWATGKLGNAVQFDGDNDFISLGTSFDTSSLPFTLSAWIKPTSFADHGTIFAKRDSWDNADMRFNVTLYQGGGQVAVQTPASDLWTHPVVIELNKWTHLVVVVQSGSVLVYTNGSHWKTIDPFILGSDSGALTTIGGTDGGGSDNFTGLIDDVRIYNVALSAQDVEGLYNGGAGCP